MTNETNLRDELLRQNGLSSNEFTRRDRDNLHKAIHLSEKRVRRLKWVVGISWTIVLVGYFVGLPTAALMENHFHADSSDTLFHTAAFSVGILFLLSAASFVIAVVSTISLFIRSGFLRSRQLEDIRLSLHDLENELMKTRQKDS